MPWAFRTFSRGTALGTIAMPGLAETSADLVQRVSLVTIWLLIVTMAITRRRRFSLFCTEPYLSAERRPPTAVVGSGSALGS